MGYFSRLWREFRWLLAKLEALPQHPYAPFYARWKHVLQERLKLLHQQAGEARLAPQLSVVATWKGWVLVAPATEETTKPLVEAQHK